MSRLLAKLDLPVNWVTPNGAPKKYTKLQFLGPAPSGPKISRTLISWVEDKQLGHHKEKLDKLDKGKQSSAIVPNIIHSLDSVPALGQCGTLVPTGSGASQKH